VLILGCVVLLLPLLYYKYADFSLENWNALTGLSVPLLRLALPLGISFYTFQILSYVLDVHRGEARVQKNPLDFLAYVSFFPQLIAGPIVRYQTVQDELASRNHTLADFSSGVSRFCVGLGKKVLIANSLASLVSSQEAGASALSWWLVSAAYTLQLYFDFSGYSDMAIGLGRMFGFHFPENFAHPFCSKSVTEFWRRWHISLGTWFRDYVYIPLGGSRCSRARRLLNILAVWMLTGLWHGASWTFFFWGLFFALLLLGEKFLWGKALAHLPGVLQSVYVMLLVNFSFVLFRAGSLGAALQALGGMFGSGVPGVSQTALYGIASCGPLLLIAAVGATPLPALAGKKLCALFGGRAGTVLEPLFCLLVLLAATGFLVSGSFNPFLYFRF
jgi:alginate O-acetyltransferase complex protein AlgI